MTATILRAREDELTLCNQRHLWATHNEMIGRLDFMLLPHGHNYLSPFNALFLYHRQSLHHLSHFKNIFVRDGALTLLKFFLSTRTPHFFKSHLIIHEDLAYLVPREWKQQIYFYRPFQVPKIQRQKAAPRTNLLLTGIIDHINAPTESIKQSLEKLNHQSYEKVKAFFRMPNPEGENQFWKLNQHYGKTLALLIQKFPQIEFLTWEGTRAINAHETDFLDLGQTHFWYADSYVHHFLQQRSAYSPLMLPTERSLETVLLSPYHGFELHQEWPARALELSDFIYQEYDRAEPYAFKEEKSYPKKDQICTQELVTFLTSIIEKNIE